MPTYPGNDVVHQGKHLFMGIVDFKSTIRIAGVAINTVLGYLNGIVAGTEKFTAGGKVRVRLVYAVCNSLDDAA